MGGTSVPVTAVYEDGHLGFGEEHVGPAPDAFNRQGSVYSVSQAPCMNELTDRNFRSGSGPLLPLHAA